VFPMSKFRDAECDICMDGVWEGIRE